MRRLAILLRTELKAWARDPITALGGFIAPGVMLLAFGLLFGGERSFPIALVNRDQGPAGAMLAATMGEVMSPFDQPYYRPLDLREDEAWQAFASQRIDAVWVVPRDFSQQLQMGQYPHIEMHFNNYIDDRAKNHRIYAAEILWRFYQKAGQRSPPLALAETYPLPVLVDWFWLIGAGIVLLGVTLGAMFNIFMLTYKEQVSQVTLEFGLSPRPLAEILLPKVVLALVMGLLTGTVFLVVLYVWVGIWPGRFLWAVALLCGLVALSWISLALVMGLRMRHYMAGAIASILLGVIAFFVSGGLAPLRYYPQEVQVIARLFPNAYAIDPLRDLMLFHSWPATWGETVLVLAGFAAVALAVSLAVAARSMRRLG
jgi:ABC-type multidrug transport system permease subunit